MQSSEKHRTHLEDQIALRDLMAKYSDAVNRRDSDSWIDCWTETGEWNLMGMKVAGKQHILNLWQQMMSEFEFVLMMPNSCLVDINDDIATGHWYLHEYTRDLKGVATTILSRYQDTYRKQQGQWRYQTREYQFIYNGETNLKGQFTPPL